ncbi:hypothetical protein CLROS_007210 [Clostridium felsineum]|uniref:Uncharacterized protein n=1 Tax=Clostridium felsineum TaxID=36839 RepID=A0A1S8LUW2_9CLOT|nr:hypothetical protein CLAUR_017400 [Clostridium felsineum]URZ05396.1 hypothetical protein CLROS_007210 [Clostridium felsineum]URZ10437.1 hypothetical protein CROST_011460 [Clostridium felsineum]URZ17634.1 hypothetical protein CLFE_036880 [Clostridium felsineum DSM 794]
MESGPHLSEDDFNFITEEEFEECFSYNLLE